MLQDVIIVDQVGSSLAEYEKSWPLVQVIGVQHPGYGPPASTHICTFAQFMFIYVAFPSSVGTCICPLSLSRLQYLLLRNETPFLSRHSSFGTS